VPDDRATPPDYLGLATPYDPASEEFAELRELLLGGERRELEELKRRLDAQGLQVEELADRLPEAIALRGGRDGQLARALAPTIDDAIRESVRQSPRDIATAIFPVLGPAIRKAIAETMAGLVESINRAVEHTFSLRGLKWRLEAWRTGTPYPQIVIKHSLVYRVEQVFLIHTETGLLLAHAAPAELKVADADLVSGMLTAIQDFVGDSFRQQETGTLRTFSVGELTVLVERGPQATLAAVVRGQPPDTLLPRLQERLELIHLRFAAAFADFTGDAAPFALAQSALEECLETVLQHQRPRGAHGKLLWLRWAAPAVLVVALLGWLAWRSQQRFRVAVARLEAEPGIELTSAERSIGGRWRLRGLRDPLAARPAAILAGLGMDTIGLDARWKPYASLEPSLTVARARQALSAPATVTLRLGGDTLFVSGSAPLPWVARVKGLAVLPSGVSALDHSALETTLPPDLAAVKTDIEGGRIHFDIGSAALLPAERDLLPAIASAFLQLRGATAGLGYRSELELLGRTDPTGTDATNQSLSRSRVESVRAVLTRLGVPSQDIRGTALGTSNPLPEQGDLDQARANRSVVFQVRLSLLSSGAVPR